MLLQKHKHAGDLAAERLEHVVDKLETTKKAEWQHTFNAEGAFVGLLLALLLRFCLICENCRASRGMGRPSYSSIIHRRGY